LNQWLIVDIYISESIICKNIYYLKGTDILINLILLKTIIYIKNFYNIIRVINKIKWEINKYK